MSNIVDIANKLKDDIVLIFQTLAADQDKVIERILSNQPKNTAFQVGKLALDFSFEPESKELVISIIDMTNKVTPICIQFTGSGHLYGEAAQIDAAFCQFVEALLANPEYILDAAQAYTAKKLHYISKEEIN